MTAHRSKPTITIDRVTWFTEYLRKNPAWGVFHVSLDDANYELGASVPLIDAGPDVDEAVRWFNMLSPSQRRRLAIKCKAALRGRP